jgi:hypothetical protein
MIRTAAEIRQHLERVAVATHQVPPDLRDKCSRGVSLIALDLS